MLARIKPQAAPPQTASTTAAESSGPPAMLDNSMMLELMAQAATAAPGSSPFDDPSAGPVGPKGPPKGAAPQGPPQGAPKAAGAKAAPPPTPSSPPPGRRGAETPAKSSTSKPKETIVTLPDIPILAGEPTSIEAAITAWEKANRDAAFDTLTHALTVMERYAILTGGAGYECQPGAWYKDLAEGVWGNVSTDAPEVLAFKSIGKFVGKKEGNGLADAAGNFAKDKLVAKIGGRFPKLGAVVGFAGGLATGLIVSAVLATVTEMIFDAITGKAASDALEADKVALGIVKQTVGDFGSQARGAVDVAKAKTDVIADGAAGWRQAAKMMSEEEIEVLADILAHDAAAIRAIAPDPNDDSKAYEMARTWALANTATFNPLVGVNGEATSNGRVNEAAWGAAMTDAAVMNAGEAAAPTARVGSTHDYNLVPWQLSGQLNGAGLDSKGIPGIQTVPKDPEYTMTRVAVVDPRRFALFVQRNWGKSITPEQAKGWKANVIVKTARVKMVANAMPIPSYNYVLVSTEHQLFEDVPNAPYLPGKVFPNVETEKATTPVDPVRAL